MARKRKLAPVSHRCCWFRGYCGACNACNAVRIQQCLFWCRRHAKAAATPSTCEPVVAKPRSLVCSSPMRSSQRL